MTASSRFWDRIADRYAREPVPDEAVYQEKLRLTREYLRPHMKALEFGCGSGKTAIVHAPLVRQIHGIDSSGKMVEIARAKASASSASNVTFEQVSIEDYPAADRSFDAVLGLNVLHLLENWRAAIGKVHSILKPGGIFVSTTPCLGGKYAWFRRIAPLLGHRLGWIPLVQIFTAEEMLNTFRSAGFSVAHEWRPNDGRTIFVIAQKRP